MEGNFLGMSDEDFLKQSAPEGVPIEQAQPAEPASEKTEVQDQAVTEGQDPTNDQATGEDEGTAAAAADENKSATEAGGEDNQASAASSGTEGTQEEDASTGSGSQGNPTEGASNEATKEGVKEKGTEEAGKDATKATTPDYEAFYKQIMAPFVANGKTIELRSPEEAISLMQMGANYTRKMQAIAPHRKVLMMLEANGLLDEGKLSFLIDIEKKNPEAIKKLVKDSGLDPHDIDVISEPAYREGNHRVSDEEANFRTALDDLKSTQTGKETLNVIGEWDQASKEVLWKSPEVMGIIHQQREAGIYDRIATEVNRQRTIGRISPEVPFLQAYKAVGDELVAAGAFADLVKASPAAAHTPAQSPVTPAPVATRVAAPKPAVTNGDRASAASTTRTTPQKAAPLVNPLAMSDEEFMKAMEGRL